MLSYSYTALHLYRKMRAGGPRMRRLIPAYRDGVAFTTATERRGTELRVLRHELRGRLKNKAVRRAADYMARIYSIAPPAEGGYYGPGIPLLRQLRRKNLKRPKAPTTSR